MLRWFLLLAMAQAPALIASESPSASNSSSPKANDTRIFAIWKTCQLDQPSCACSWITNSIPQPMPVNCLWDVTTCQCGWEVGTGTGTFVRTGSDLPLALDKTCVVDGRTCTCLAGYLPLPSAVEATTVSIESFVANIASQITQVNADIDKLIPQIRLVAVDPTGAMPALSLEQREKLIAEPISTMALLKDVVGDETSFERLELGERQALGARLRVELAYLGRLREDPEFMAAQLGKMADGEVQPMVQRLRGVLAELEMARRKAGETSI